ncbi:MAG: hypothetical protein LC754_15800 [Acidobacteria bacterium]|nr:hypothetical protein [Acidobacteriota bacterium]
MKQQHTQLVAWMPEGSPASAGAHAEVAQIVGAVEGEKGQKLDLEIYLSLLANRLQKSVEQADDPKKALSSLIHVLTSSRMLTREMSPASPEQIHGALFENFLIRERLYQIGVPGDLPPSLEQDDPQARHVIKQTTPEQWAKALTEPHG